MPLSETEWRITLTEGRYHQVKRMFAAVGNDVLALHREAIGQIVLDSQLAPGAARALRAEEIAAFDPGKAPG
jgi:16S rRNA pseudouridine516 synthase